LKNSKIKGSLTEQELDRALDPTNYLGTSKTVVTKVVKTINNSKLIK